MDKSQQKKKKKQSLQINLSLDLIAINVSGLLFIDFLEIPYNGGQRFDDNKIGHSAKSLGEGDGSVKWLGSIKVGPSAAHKVGMHIRLPLGKHFSHGRDDK